MVKLSYLDKILLEKVKKEDLISKILWPSKPSEWALEWVNLQLCMGRTFVHGKSHAVGFIFHAASRQVHKFIFPKEERKVKKS